MKEKLKREKVVTEYTEITICDRCGLEADNEIRLLANPEIKITEEGKREMAMLEQDYLNGISHQKTAYDLRISSRYYDIDHNGEVTVCEACYDEMFGWLK